MPEIMGICIKYLFMRQLYITLFSGLAIFFTACSGPYFNNVNDMSQMTGTVYTNDGKEITGPLTIELDPYRSSRLYLTVNDKDAKQKISITDIKGINFRNDYYEPKLIDMGGLGNNDEFRFVERLTKEGSRIHLYELNQKVSRQRGSRYNRYGSSGTYTDNETSYYITTPQHTRQMPAWSLEGRRLTPNFEDKMSEIVKDCPALAAKIKNKEKGYFYAQVSLVDTKKIETMFTIIEEYNKCGVSP
jgi:hypothetical protein